MGEEFPDLSQSQQDEEANDGMNLSPEMNEPVNAEVEPLQPTEIEHTITHEAPETSGTEAEGDKHVRVTELASAFHEDWRKTRKQEDGSFEPRIKETKDEAWIQKHGTNQVDIANTTFGELPED